mmetsp:Transcript_100389/g.178414  ORF Transcript_100389/g.178414 Transcript_100389/m.178414 type:complete len:152 (-) Transcript_100389:30-485(-)
MGSTLSHRCSCQDKLGDEVADTVVAESDEGSEDTASLPKSSTGQLSIGQLRGSHGQPGAAYEHASENFIRVQVERDPMVMGLGLAVDHHVDLSYLVVAEILEGPFMDWNRRHAKKVMAGQKIVQVNGISGDSRKMLESCKLSTKLDMIFAQ